MKHFNKVTKIYPSESPNLTRGGVTTKNNMTDQENDDQTTAVSFILKPLASGRGDRANDHDIERPDHYVKGRTIECIDIIEDWNLNHHLACALKYISRAGRKDDEIKDLKKAVWYLNRRIKYLEQQDRKEKSRPL